MLEETLQICRQMWSDDDGPYDGKHYQLAETLCVPQPIRRPPILIGGDGEKKTLRLVAQYADIWNSMATDVDELKHKMEVLNRHCETVGRDPAEIRKTCGGLAVVDPFEDTDEYLKTVNASPSLASRRSTSVRCRATPTPSASSAGSAINWRPGWLRSAEAAKPPAVQ